MLWAEAGLSAIIVAMCVLDHVFFPPLPPLPPSASASAKREVHIFRDSLKLIRNPNFLVIAIAYGISLGTYSGWSGVLDPILAPLHYSQDTVNWLGFASTVGCVIGGVGFGNLGDRVRRVKLVIILLFVASFLLIGWFSLIANHVVGRSTWQLFLSCTLGR
jgi:MFS transporter, FLVCR family, disrupted in renal carcinoma protein 2